MTAPTNLLTLTLSDASTKLVYIKKQQFDWITGHTGIQWAEVVVSGQTWARATLNGQPVPDLVIDAILTQAGSVTYMGLTLTAQLNQINGFLTAYYNNIITAAAVLNV